MEKKEKELEVINVERDKYERNTDARRCYEKSKALYLKTRRERKRIQMTKKVITAITLVLIGAILFALGLINGSLLYFLYAVGC